MFSRDDSSARFSCVSDNVVVLSTDMNTSMKRSITVLKERVSAHDLGTHELGITASGLRVR